MDFKQKLRNEGFAHVYEWDDAPGTSYPPHAHKGKVSFYVTYGQVTVTIRDREIVVKEGQRLDIPVGIEHAMEVGPQGCTFIIGEEILGDW